MIICILSACNPSKPKIITNPDDIVGFEVISCEDTILHRGMAVTENIKYGFEGGRIVKEGDTYHWITAEQVGDPFVANMSLGYWTSKDGTNWQRQRTLRKSDGDYTGVSQYASVWGPMMVFIEEDNRWHLFYVCYKSKPDEPNIFYAGHHGVIQHAVSDVKGRDGIGGPYTDREILMRYEGGNPDPWEGLQGVDSFFPYKIKNKWYALYGSATTQDLSTCKWQIGLAQAPRIEGPWTRMSEKNPVDFVHFAENPIVQQLENGVYIALIDGGPWVNKMGYSLSYDGVNWSPLRHFELEPVVQKWWVMMRTPLSLIKENDGSYTLFFTAFKDYEDGLRYGTLSKVSLKMKFK
jgi:hypothetical protein